MKQEDSKKNIRQVSNDNTSKLQSPFEQLREVDAEGKEWWNSRKLARVMGYGKYWNFERVMAKAQAWVTQKGYHLGEHFVEFTEMAELGNGGVRQVTSIKLSRAACMAIAMNADQKKDMVKVAQEYFSATMTSDVAVRSMESTILLYKGARGKTQVQVVFEEFKAVLSQFIAKLATSDDDTPVGVVTHALAVLPEADIDIQTSPVNTDADAILVPHNTARISVSISLAKVEIEVTNQVIVISFVYTNPLPLGKVSKLPMLSLTRGFVLVHNT